MKVPLIAFLFIGISGCISDGSVETFDLEVSLALISDKIATQNNSNDKAPFAAWMEDRIAEDDSGCWTWTNQTTQLMDANLPQLAALSFARDGCFRLEPTPSQLREDAKARGALESEYRANWDALNDTIAGAVEAFPASYGSAQELEFALGLAMRLGSIAHAAANAPTAEAAGEILDRYYSNFIYWNRDANQQIWLTLNTYPWGSGCVGDPVHTREDVHQAAVEVGNTSPENPRSGTTQRILAIHDFVAVIGLSSVSDYNLVELNWLIARDNFEGPMPNGTQMTALLGRYLSEPIGGAAQQAFRGYFEGHVFAYEPIREHRFYDDGSDAHWGPILATLPELDRGDLRVRCDPNHI